MLGSIAAQAYDFKTGGIYYDITSESEKTAAVTYYEFEKATSTYTNEVAIPKTVKNADITYTVTAIGDEAFYNCKELTGVSIPETVISFGENAFENCEKLAKLTIPKSVATIGKSAFYNCISLTEFIVDSDNQNFTAVDGVLYNKDLTTIICYPICKFGEFIIPSTVKQIEGYAFACCSQLTKITISNSVESIGRAGFSYCTSLREIYLPESVSSIDINVFWGCSKLDNFTVSPENSSFAAKDGVLYNKDFTILVAYPAGKEGDFTIPNNVISLNTKAFCGNSKLTSVVLSESIEEIPESCFNKCESLRKVVIPNSVTAIGPHAFEGCLSLSEINLPESLTSIGDFALAWCTSLKSVTIPKSITVLNVALLCACSSLTEINLPSTITCIGQWAIYDCTSLTDIIIPESVTKIDYGAFLNCTSLKSIYIPDNVTYIDDATFYGCSALTNAHLPAGLTTINTGLFCDCTSLESIEIPKTVTRINEWAFESCIAIKSIDIPAAVTYIEESAFLNCSSLENVISRNPVPPTVDNINAFEGCDIAAVYVPQESVSDYQNAAVWHNYNIVGADLDGITDAAVDVAKPAEKCYDLNGRRISRENLSRGLYIIDGHKVLVK
jgi:hypothetical protein